MPFQIPRKAWSGQMHDWKPIVAWDHAGKDFTQILMNEITSVYRLSPEELGIIGRNNKDAAMSYSNFIPSNTTGLAEKVAKACGCSKCQKYLKSKENTDMSPFTFTVDLSNISRNPTPEQSFLSEVEAKAKDNPDLAKQIKEAAERAEKARNERIQKALDGSAELELLKGPQGKLFVLKYLCRGKERTLYGTAYPGYDADEEDAKELEGRTVFLQADTSSIVCNAYETIRHLKTHLESSGILYVIKFFD